MQTMLQNERVFFINDINIHRVLFKLATSTPVLNALATGIKMLRAAQGISALCYCLRRRRRGYAELATERW